MRTARLAWVLALFSISLGCSDDDPTPNGDEVGDGDGDGDGDGEPGDGDGDGDGEPGDGDGDELPSLPPGFLDELTNAGGCGDVYIGVSNEAGTMALLFNGAELAATAQMLGETQVRESTLPSADVNLRIALGTLLDDGCNDTGDGPAIDYEWTAVSGTVTLTVAPEGEPQPWENPGRATLELSNVSFEGDGVAPVVVDSWSVADVYVGWLPG